MKKNVSKIHKIIISIMVAIVTIPSKIFATSLPIVQPLYAPAPPVESSKASMISRAWIILKNGLIPISLLIGFIVYFKKSKSSKKKKMLILVGIIVITVIVLFAI